MINKNNMKKTSQKAFKLFLRNEVLKKSKKMRGKFPPFSEIIDDNPKVLKIVKVYDLSNLFKNFYLLIAKNYSKNPKERYFLAVKLASQSSDLLVNLSNEFAYKNSLKLIQYTINPKLLRVSLISLKEIENIDDFTNSIDTLKECRKNFLNILIKIKNFAK